MRRTQIYGICIRHYWQAEPIISGTDFGRNQEHDREGISEVCFIPPGAFPNANLKVSHSSVESKNDIEHARAAHLGEYANDTSVPKSSGSACSDSSLGR